MSNIPTDTDRLLAIAKEYQQIYYERLPDWHEYGFGAQKYMKQNIAFALFGLPVDRQKDFASLVSNSSDANSHADVFDKFKYDAKSAEIIDTVYQKVTKYGSNDRSFSLHLGIVYNVIYYTKTSEGSSTEHDHAKQRSNGQKQQQSDEVYAVPIFKIRRNGDPSVIWYVDGSGRVYKSWVDYKRCNTLPECTMVLPKHGSYRADPGHPITLENSTVWLEIASSPACATSRKVLTALDAVSTVLGVGTAIGVGAAAVLTPVGPVLAIAGLAGSGISGLWTIGRCTQTLADLDAHEESIAPTTKKALPAWLGITGSAIGIGTSGGSVLLARAAANGKYVNGISRLAFNSLKIGNLTVNGVGMVCKGYSLVEKYRESKEIEMIDVLIFASHVLFFCNAVLNVQLADELIKSSRGNHVEEFTKNLSAYRSSAEYSRTRGLNGQQDLGIVRPVKKIYFRMDFMKHVCNAVWQNCANAITFPNGKLAINNVVLMEPMQFVGILLTTGFTTVNVSDMLLTRMCKKQNGLLVSLKCSLSRLLKEYAAENGDCAGEKLPTDGDFDSVLEELKYVSNASELLPKMLKIAMAMLNHYNDPKDLLAVAFRFVWEYSKENLKACNVNKCTGLQAHELLWKLVASIFDVLDSLVEPMYRAFCMYRSQAVRASRI